MPASASVITAYYKGSSPSQSSIYKTMHGVAPKGIDNSRALLYYKSRNELNKPNSRSLVLGILLIFVMKLTIIDPCRVILRHMLEFALDTNIMVI